MIISNSIPGQKLLGVPIVVQPSQAEKNRVGNYSDPMIRPEKGPMKLYVGNLHSNISDDMLRGIFEPFGRIQSIQLMKVRDKLKERSETDILIFRIRRPTDPRATDSSPTRRRRTPRRRWSI